MKHVDEPVMIEEEEFDVNLKVSAPPKKVEEEKKEPPSGKLNIQVIDDYSSSEGDNNQEHSQYTSSEYQSDV